jgi:phosphohistidine phosphatase
MKELLLYRHAKAEKSVPGIRDHERPLSAEGEKQAESIGERIREESSVPDLILTSDARRALSTARIAALSAGCPERVHAVAALFDGEIETYAQEIRLRGGKAARLMVVGHNPTMEELVERLAGRRIEIKAGYLVRVAVRISSWEAFDFGENSEIQGVLMPEA